MDHGCHPDTSPTRRDDGPTRRLAALHRPLRTGRLLALVFTGIVLGVFALTMAMCTGLTTLVILVQRPALALCSAFAALALGLPYLGVILWLDRNEREPWHLVLGTLIWGAVTATAVSAMFNAASQALFGVVAPDEAAAAQLTASFSAPFFEEISKGLALGTLFLFFYKDFDGVLDGIVYGAIIGLGFATFENFTYYVGTGSLGGVVALTWVRGVLSGLGSHVTFTAITGMGFGLARVARRGWWRALVPLCFLGLAMFSHFAWNTFSSLFLSPDNGVFNLLVGLPVAVVVLQAPFVTFVSFVAIGSLFWEARLIRRYLADEPPGVLRPDDLARLVPARKRALHALGLFLTLRWGRMLQTRRRDHRLVRLAFEHWHMDSEERAGNKQQAGEHAQRMLELRRVLAAS